MRHVSEGENNDQSLCEDFSVWQHIFLSVMRQGNMRIYYIDKIYLN